MPTAVLEKPEASDKVLSQFASPQTDTGYGVVKLSRQQVKEAWGEHSILNDSSYIWLAINFMRREDESDFTLDVDEFCDIWEYEPEAGKVKRLKPKAVRDAISKFRSVGIVSIPEEPIQMSLLF